MATCYLPASMSRALVQFRGLREDLPTEGVAALRRAVRNHLATLVEAQRESELIALDLAEQLCSRLEGLLELAPQMSPDERSMIVGAARYFVSDEDVRPDAASCTGLDDDVEVFNHVASELGRTDLLIADG